MKYYIISLSRPKVGLVFIGTILFGTLLLYIRDIRFIILGFGIITFALHELGHLFAFKIRHYDVMGFIINIWPPKGIGPLPDRPIDSKDSTIVYFSGLLLSIIVPFYIMYYTLEIGVWFLVGAVLLSTLDILEWWHSRKRCQKYHSIRRGRKGDRPISFVAGKVRTPSYVLLCDNQQVGAMVGNAGLIVFLEVFEPYRGVKHSAIFLELLEREARSQGISRIEMATPTIEPKFIAALKRCGFHLVKEEQDGNCWFAKDL